MITASTCFGWPVAAGPSGKETKGADVGKVLRSGETATRRGEISDAEDRFGQKTYSATSSKDEF